MQSLSINCREEMSLQELLQRNEEQTLLGEQLRVESAQILGCPVLQEHKRKALEDDEAHKKSVELSLKDSKEFRKRMDQSMKKIDVDIEYIKNELNQLNKIRYECEDSSSHDYSCTSLDLGSCWLPCRGMKQCLAILIVTVLLILILILVILRI